MVCLFVMAVPVRLMSTLVSADAWEAQIVHEIAQRLLAEGLWDELEDFVKDAYIQNAINWGLEFYASCTFST